MKAVIFSDSHGAARSMADFLDSEQGVDLIIFAGDVNADIEELMELYPRKKFEYVLGNNDYFVSGVPFDRVFDFGGKRIFLTHGHKYGVKMGLYRLSLAAREKNADICIFGHTHSKLLEEENGIIFINPGPARRSCCVLDINEGIAEVSFR